MKTRVRPFRTSILLLFLLSWSSIVSQAQVNSQDSTVAFIAYWNLGDKYYFDHKATEYRITGTDTVRTDHDTERFSLEVIDSTSHSYLLEYRCLAETHFTQDSLENQLLEKLQKELSQDIAIRIQTDEFGSIQKITNLKEIRSLLDKVAKKTKKLLLREIKQQAKAQGSGLPDKEALAFLDGMMSVIFNAYTSEQGILASMSYLTRLFDYHGAALRLDSTYTSSYFTPSPFGADKDSIPTRTYVSCEMVNEDSLYVQCYCSNEYDTEKLVNSLIESFNQNSDSEHQIPHEPEAPVFYMEDYYNQVIHVGAGWTTELYSRRTTVNKDTRIIKEYSVDMVFPDDETPSGDS